MTNQTDFELEVIDRLARIETKMDTQNGIVKKACEDVKVLQDKEIAAEGERKMLRKIVAAIGGSVGIVSTIIGIMVAIGKV